MVLYEITFSPTGGTQKVAHMLSEAWNCKKTVVNLLKPLSDAATPLFTSEDVCIVTMPVFGGRIPATAAERLQKLNGHGAKAILAAVYGNRAIDDALVEMEDILETRGFTIVAGLEAIAEHSLVREIAAGRPDQEDHEVLRTFGKQILEKLEAENFTKPTLPGNRPYKVFNGGLKPAADDTCRGCGICAAECPVGAIPMEAPQTTDTEKCISCMRCIKICPNGSRKNDPAMLEALAQRLAPRCEGRKANKLYI